MIIENRKGSEGEGNFYKNYQLGSVKYILIANILASILTILLYSIIAGIFLLINREVGLIILFDPNFFVVSMMMISIVGLTSWLIRKLDKSDFSVYTVRVYLWLCAISLLSSIVFQQGRASQDNTQTILFATIILGFLLFYQGLKTDKGQGFQFAVILSVLLQVGLYVLAILVGALFF